MIKKSLAIFGIFILLFFLFSSLKAAQENILNIKDNLKKAKAGDYLVFCMNKTMTLLYVQEVKTDSIIFQEICLSSNRLPSPWKGWKSWVQEKAPNHITWLQYNLSLSSYEIPECYCFQNGDKKKCTLKNNTLTTLIHLNFFKIPEGERKKAGPPPTSGSPDFRRVWNPPLFFEGKKIENVFFDGWKTRWPNDGSELANRVIIAYLPKETGQYPSYFPYWLQIHGFVGKAKIRIIDSGKGLVSPFQ